MSKCKHCIFARYSKTFNGYFCARLTQSDILQMLGDKCAYFKKKE